MICRQQRVLYLACIWRTQWCSYFLQRLLLIFYSLLDFNLKPVYKAYNNREPAKINKPPEVIATAEIEIILLISLCSCQLSSWRISRSLCNEHDHIFAVMTSAGGHTTEWGQITFAFPEKSASVPYVVEKAILPNDLSLSDHEYEYSRRQTDVEKAKKVVERHQNWVPVYQQDLPRDEEEEKERVDIKICRKRKEAGHDDMMTATREPMTSAEIKVKGILRQIHSVELHNLNLS